MLPGSQLDKTVLKVFAKGPLISMESSYYSMGLLFFEYAIDMMMITTKKTMAGIPQIHQCCFSYS